MKHVEQIRWTTCISSETHSISISTAPEIGTVISDQNLIQRVLQDHELDEWCYLNVLSTPQRHICETPDPLSDTPAVSLPHQYSKAMASIRR